MPLTGVGVFIVSDLRSVNDVRARAAVIDSDVRELVLLNQFRAALLDERNWAAATVGLDELEISDDDVARMVGVSVSDNLSAATADVDSLLRRIGDEALRIELAQMRDDLPSDFVAAGFAYSNFEARVAESSQRDVDQLLVVAGQIGGGSGLIDVLRILESATLARQAVSSQLTEYFALQFSGAVGLGPDLDGLVEQREVYLLARSQIDRVRKDGSHVADAVVQIENSPDASRFDTAVDELTQALLKIGSPAAPTDGPEIQPLDELGEVFLAAVTSSLDHLALVDAAGTDVTDVSTGLIEEADAEFRAVILRALVIVLSSFAGALAIAHLIGKPLRELALAARRLRDGDTMMQHRPNGPAEVREAGEAISEAAAHLELATHQANALASGAFDHPVLADTAPGALGASLQDALSTLVSSLSDREQFRRLLAHEATHDALTKLTNRRAVMARLDECLARTRRDGTCLAVMFLDLDQFKGVNDRFGHPAGDAVLRTIGERLALAVRGDDHVGRLGGDEFLIVAEPVHGADDAIQLAERMLAAVSGPISHNGAVVAVSASIGVALVDEHTMLSSEEILTEADVAVYHAKALGRSRIVLCDEDLRAELGRRKTLEAAVVEAIARDQFVLHYQPIVDPVGAHRGGFEVFAYEALIRWHHPTEGFTGPGSFIPFAERSDLILDIDRWVVDNAVRQLAAWTDCPERGGIPVSVNISGRHLASGSVVESILGPLHRHGVDPSLLIIEVTESALLDDMAVAADHLQTLRDRGVRIAIDDFGTGYTSLAHLRSLPFDILKIDQSFTSDPEAGSLVKLIIDTGHLLGARITVEGVETAEQADTLIDMGADELQGFFFACPEPAPVPAPGALETAGESIHGV